MRKLIYHVATTIDNFIAHEDGSTNGFLPEGDHIPEYLEHLKAYDTVIMGRKTYEYGYDFGLKPGQPAYPHMMHYIFSSGLQFEEQHEQVKIIRENSAEFVKKLKESEGSDIYLCGGGNFAGFMLEHHLIDELILKLNPVIFGKGIPLFGDYRQELEMKLMSTKVYESGVLLLRYGVG